MKFWDLLFLASIVLTALDILKLQLRANSAYAWCAIHLSSAFPAPVSCCVNWFLGNFCLLPRTCHSLLTASFKCCHLSVAVAPIFHRIFLASFLFSGATLIRGAEGCLLLLCCRILGREGFFLGPDVITSGWQLNSPQVWSARLGNRESQVAIIHPRME